MKNVDSQRFLINLEVSLHIPRLKMKKTRCFKVNKFNILAQAPFIKVNKFYFRG